MQKKDYTQKLRERIAKASDGALFVMLDFADIAPNNAANRIVMRLVGEGLLRTVIRGVYQKPKINKFLGECEEPSSDAVAHALARKSGWTISPTGDTALNLLGLSTQVPANWCYLSNGPYKTYGYGAGKIRFMHTANRMIQSLSDDSSLVVQALRALGEPYMDEAVTARLSAMFSARRWAKIEAETRNVPDWIHTAIVRMKESVNA